jgi:hypothetical protein
MILTGEPFVSGYLRDTILREGLTVIDTPGARELVGSEEADYVGEREAAEILSGSGESLLYTVSESAIGWIAENLRQTGIPEKIEIFKDKVKFRELTSSLHPDLYYREVSARELTGIDMEKLPVPAVIKPAVGFFSLGVNTVSATEEWESAVRSIEDEAEASGSLYPDRVLDTSRFIIEEYIEGEEFAIDIYAGPGGEPVVVGIFKHLFGSEKDVSDRVYVTSAEIIEERLEQFTEFAENVIGLASLRNFPFHAEVRIDGKGRPVPIEINPMRFGAWCTTADITGIGFGINPYEKYFYGRKPDWESVISGKKEKVYSLIALNNTTGVDQSRIGGFDYRKLLSRFEKPLELREWDFRKNPLFGFLITETGSDDISELEQILRSDLSEFLLTPEGGEDG